MLAHESSFPIGEPMLKDTGKLLGFFKNPEATTWLVLVFFPKDDRWAYQNIPNTELRVISFLNDV